MDYLENKGTREIFIHDCDQAFAERQILLLDRGKVHFERPNLHLMRIAKEKGHKVSVICNLEDLAQEDISDLAHSDFVRVRVGRNHDKLSLLSHLSNEGVLSCVKFYVGEGVAYHDLALHIRDMGFDFIHVTRRLTSCSGNYPISETEKEAIMKLKELETKNFRVVIPSSLEQQFAKRFLITPEMGNVSSCLFSAYRTVLKGNSIYPCYTQRILDQDGVK